MPEIGDIFQLAMEFTGENEEKYFNTYDFLVSLGSCTDLELMTALATLMTTAYNYLSGTITNTIDEENSRLVKMLWTGTKWEVDRYVGLVVPTITFNNSGDYLPQQVAPLVTFLTTKPRLAPKKYLFGIGEDQTADGLAQGSALGDMVDYMSEFLEPISAGSATLAYVARRKDGTVWGPYGATANAVLSTQRRRKLGVGV